MIVFQKFFGNGHFSKANEFLRLHGRPEIEWNLVPSLMKTQRATNCATNTQDIEANTSKHNETEGAREGNENPNGKRHREDEQVADVESGSAKRLKE